MKKLIFTSVLFLFQINFISAQQGWFTEPSFTTMNLYDCKQTATFYLYIASDSGTVFRSSNSGSVWNIYNFNDPLLNNESFKFIYGGNNDNWSAVGQHTAYGYNYAPVDSVYRISSSSPQPTLEAFSHIQGYFFYSSDVTAGDGGNFYIKDGTNWRKDTAATRAASGIDINYCSQIIFVGDNGLIMKADSVGFTHTNGERIKWRVIPSGTTKNLYAVARGGGTTFTAVGEDGIIIKSTDLGETWNQLQSPVTEDLYGIYLNYRYFICGANGVILKADQSDLDVWNTQVSPTTMDLYTIFGLNYTDFIAMGENGIFIRTTDGGVGITQISNEVPSVYNLSQNYPNPFNPSTKIRFDIKNININSSDVIRLNVYDALGKKISTLVNEALNTGSYEVEFNGSDFTSGIYFYKLEAGEFIETKKMMLIR